MIVSIHQPNFLPWVGFFHKIVMSDCFIILDNVQFRKQNYQNRTFILGQNKLKKVLTCPVYKKGKLTQKIFEVGFCNKTKWNMKLAETVRYAYKNASFFDESYSQFENIMSKKWDYLLDLNFTLIIWLNDLLGIKKEIVFASQLGGDGQASDLLINLVQKVGGSHYLSGIKGKEYLEEYKFKEHGIELLYQEFSHPEYYQKGNPKFVAGLSVIDLLFNVGVSGSREILQSLSK